MPKFRLILTSERNLIGPADPRPRILVAGGTQGTYVRYSQSIPTTDPAFARNGGELTLPDPYTDPVYNVDWLNSHMACIMEGPGAWLFMPKDLSDFLEVSIFNPDGTLRRKLHRPFVYSPENFIENKWSQTFNNQIQTAFQVNDLGWNGEAVAKAIHKLEYRVNPRHGECDPIAVSIEFNGHNLKIVDPVITTWQPVSETDKAPEMEWNKTL